MIENGQIVENILIRKNIFRLTVKLPQISSLAKPGQFCEVKVNDGLTPLLRRPFSIHKVVEKNVSFLVEIKGVGTKALAQRKIGEFINILGPLGNGFNLEGNYSKAVIVAGGIGVAPFPFLVEKLNVEKEIISFVGARNKNLIVAEGLENVAIATDDGSMGFKGNVVQLVEKKLKDSKAEELKIFACGPNPMLKALKSFVNKRNIECEISAESNMACGTGLCQGCAIKSAVLDGHFLVCKDGPVFDITQIEF